MLLVRVVRGGYYAEFAVACLASSLTFSRGVVRATLKNTLPERERQRERRERERERRGREGDQLTIF